jgi:hypothetical protein
MISKSALKSMRDIASSKNSIFVLYEYTEGEWEWYSPNVGGRKGTLPKMLEINREGYRIIPEGEWQKWGSQ